MTGNYGKFHKIIMKVITVITVITIIFAGFLPGFSATAFRAWGSFDLDVVFAIEGSDRFRDADPNNFALSAVNMFIDMTEGTDSRAGFVFFSHEIIAQSYFRELLSFRRHVKNDISGLSHGGHSDIALGLDAALRMFEREHSAGAVARKPVIILISAGGRVLPYSDFLSSAIPIYTVSLSPADTGGGNIAQMTGASAFETSNARDLPEILANIYASITGAAITNIFDGSAEGGWQSVTFPIPDYTAERAIVSISSSHRITDIEMSLQSPENFPLHNSDPLGRYHVFSALNPSRGDGTVSFYGTRGANVSVRLIITYDVSLVLNLPRTRLGEAEFSWAVENAAGTNIEDIFFINTLAPTLLITNSDTDEELLFQFEPGSREITLPLVPGNYHATLFVEQSGLERISNSHFFNIPTARPMLPSTSLRLGGGAADVSLWTIFREDYIIPIRDLIYFDDANLPLYVAPVRDENWEYYVQFFYCPETNAINLRALQSGTAEIPVTVSDPHGNEVVFIIFVNISRGLFPVIGAAVLLIIIFGVIIITKIKKRPKLNTPMSKLYINMTLPIAASAVTPPECLLTLPPIKREISLAALIDMNTAIAEPYKAALEPLIGFAEGTTFSAKSAGEIQIKVPALQGYKISFDKGSTNAPDSGIISKDAGTVITISREGALPYSEYKITLGTVISQHEPGKAALFAEAQNAAGINNTLQEYAPRGNTQNIFGEYRPPQGSAQNIFPQREYPPQGPAQNIYNKYPQHTHPQENQPANTDGDDNFW